jgi:hypothetical protein
VVPLRNLVCYNKYIAEGDEFILDELQDFFEYGILGQGIRDLFKLLIKRLQNHSDLETLWIYLQELSAMRRFWIQINYDISD